jgi:hypothetical protein
VGCLLEQLKSMYTRSQIAATLSQKIEFSTSMCLGAVAHEKVITQWQRDTRTKDRFSSGRSTSPIYPCRPSSTKPSDLWTALS